MKTFKLHKFDMSKITKKRNSSDKNEKVSIFLGKRNSGKSFCVKDMLYYLKDIPVARIISGTEKANKHYTNFVPPVFIDYEYKDVIIENFMKRQETMIVKKESDMRYRDLDNRAILVLDDLMFDKNSWVTNKRIKEIAMNGRHWGVTFIITLQYCLGIPPDLRTNVDYVFLFKENRIAERQKIYKYWAGIIPSFKLFCEIMDACTNDYSCIVIDNSAATNNLEDQVFYYRAEDHGEFKMCGSRAWSFSESRGHRSSTEEAPKKKEYNIILRD